MQLNSDEVATGCDSGPQNAMDMDVDKQMIVFYTIPPDMVLAMSRSRSRHRQRGTRTAEDRETDALSGWMD